MDSVMDSAMVLLMDCVRDPTMVLLMDCVMVLLLMACGGVFSSL